VTVTGDDMNGEVTMGDSMPFNPTLRGELLMAGVEA
jgi:hypothetical protein